MIRSFRSQVYALTEAGPFQSLGIRVIQLVAANPIITGAVVGETSYMLEIAGYRAVYVRSNQDYEALAAVLRKLKI